MHAHDAHAGQSLMQTILRKVIRVIDLQHIKNLKPSRSIMMRFLMLCLSFVLVASAYIPSHHPCSPFEHSKVKFRRRVPCYRQFASEESSTPDESNIDIPDGAEGAETTKVLSLASKGLSILKIVHKNVVKKDESKQTRPFIRMAPQINTIFCCLDSHTSNETSVGLGL